MDKAAEEVHQNLRTDKGDAKRAMPPHTLKRDDATTQGQRTYKGGLHNAISSRQNRTEQDKTAQAGASGPALILVRSRHIPADAHGYCPLEWHKHLRRQSEQCYLQTGVVHRSCHMQLRPRYCKQSHWFLTNIAQHRRNAAIGDYRGASYGPKLFMQESNAAAVAAEHRPTHHMLAVVPGGMVTSHAAA
eukprot:gnl/TRDRNA2_/TRDRNA2_170109_c0_seq2.p1 gnl/TRDRNA2_/TRDRNA2_170109_c0~~gnl/TRDRNA2_/TRDRNA2_170109_c0_seq2.p1  ORF type:complete len:189 (+),score=15.01 gnl/TRDRNA2_/TRDRNA2_170109_c0_seq2:337-903(+)